MDTTDTAADVTAAGQAWSQLVVVMDAAQDALDAGDALGALGALATASVELEDLTRTAVDLALAQGARWDDVAAALGLSSRQAAHYRYSRPRTTTTHRAGERA